MASLDDRRKSEPGKKWANPYRVRWKDPATGRTKTQSFRVLRTNSRNPDEMGAEDFLHRVQAAERQGTPVQSFREERAATFAPIIDAFDASPQSSKNPGYELSDGYVKAVKTHCKVIKRLVGHLPVSHVVRDYRSVETLIRKHVTATASESTANRYMSTLNVLLAFAKDRGDLPSGIEIPSPRKSREVSAIRKGNLKSYTPEEMKAIVANAPKHFRTMFRLATLTGVRQGELVAMSVDAIDFERGTVHVYRASNVKYNGVKPCKTYEDRFVPINVPGFLDELKAHIEETADKRAKGSLNLLFPNRDGNMYHGTSLGGKLWTMVRTAAKLAPNTTFHHIRRSYGSIILSEIRDVVTVSRLLGHESIATTLKNYSAELPGRDAEVNAVLRKALG